MTETNNGLHRNNADNIISFNVSYEAKLKKAQELLGHVENCIYKHARPDPESIRKAHNLLHNVHEKAPDLFTADKAYLWEMLGWAYHIFGDMRKVDKCLRIQASLQPGLPDAYLNLGGFYDNGGMNSRAIEIYLEGLEECPGDECLMYNLAELLNRCGMYGRAAEFLNDAITKKPDCPYNHKLKGDFLKEKNSPEEAVKCYEKAIALFGPGEHSVKDTVIADLKELREQIGNNSEDDSSELSVWEMIQKDPELLDRLHQTDEFKAFMEKLADIELDIDISLISTKRKD